MHSLWKGSLSFGLVNIPVHMYTASQEKDKDLSFVLLHKKDLSEIRYARICKAEEKEVPWDEIVKGYEYEKGNFVVLQDTEFEKANLKRTKTIEIIHFVKEEEIDPIYFSKPYFLEPDKNAEKAYSLLRDALKKSQKIGIARYVLRNRERYAAIRVYKNIVIANELRYTAELSNDKNINVPKSGNSSAKEVEIAMKLIDQLTVPFTPPEKDVFEEELKKIIKKKAKGRPIHPKGQEPSSAPTKIHDMMALLKASLEEKKKPAKKSRKSA